MPVDFRRAGLETPALAIPPPSGSPVTILYESSAAERLAHTTEQDIRRERLGHERDVSVEASEPAERVTRVARHEQHAQLRVQLEQRVVQRAAVHPGHDHVAEQEIDASLLALGELQSR